MNSSRRWSERAGPNRGRSRSGRSPGRALPFELPFELAFALAFALVLASAWVACAAPPEPDALAPCPTEQPNVTDGESLVASAPGDAASGRSIFQQHCNRCHAQRLIARSSRLFHDYPRLDCPDYLETTSEPRLTAILLHGGEAFGLDKAMKPFADVLTPSEIADVVAYIRSGTAGR